MFLIVSYWVGLIFEPEITLLVTDQSSRQRGRSAGRTTKQLSLKKGKDKICSWAPKGSPIRRRTGRQTIGHKINSTQVNKILFRNVSKLLQIEFLADCRTQNLFFNESLRRQASALLTLKHCDLSLHVRPKVQLWFYWASYRPTANRGNSEAAQQDFRNRNETDIKWLSSKVTIRVVVWPCVHIPLTFVSCLSKPLI
jgi:hypothetical protein